MELRAESARVPDKGRRVVRLAVEGLQAPPNVGMHVHAFINNDTADATPPLTVENDYAGSLFLVPMTSRKALHGVSCNVGGPTPEDGRLLDGWHRPLTVGEPLPLALAAGHRPGADQRQGRAPSVPGIVHPSRL